MNYVLLDMEFDRLKNNFETFLDAKNMIALSFNETIDFIEKYVHSTEYRLNLNNKNYDS